MVTAKGVTMSAVDEGGITAATTGAACRGIASKCKSNTTSNRCAGHPFPPMAAKPHLDPRPRNLLLGEKGLWSHLQSLQESWRRLRVVDGDQNPPSSAGLDLGQS